LSALLLNVSLHVGSFEEHTYKVNVFQPHVTLFFVPAYVFLPALQCPEFQQNVLISVDQKLSCCPEYFKGRCEAWVWFQYRLEIIPSQKALVLAD
jgi:hypothetical protein